MKFIKILLVIISIALIMQTAVTLKCWRCSSDSTNPSFCGDPFDSSTITEQQLRLAYVECSMPPNAHQVTGVNPNQTRPVCKKMDQLINNEIVAISRSCWFEDANQPVDSCKRQKTPNYIQTDFCETCDHDGCNGASIFSSSTLFVMILTAVASVRALFLFEKL